MFVPIALSVTVSSNAWWEEEVFTQDNRVIIYASCSSSRPLTWTRRHCWWKVKSGGGLLKHVSHSMSCSFAHTQNHVSMPVFMSEPLTFARHLIGICGHVLTAGLGSLFKTGRRIGERPKCQQAPAICCRGASTEMNCAVGQCEVGRLCWAMARAGRHSGGVSLQLLSHNELETVCDGD